jgi:hypothetical protein
VSETELDALRRAIELFILDEARRRGLTRMLLHVDVAPIDDGKGGADVTALVMDISGVTSAEVKEAIEQRAAARKGKEN